MNRFAIPLILAAALAACGAAPEGRWPSLAMRAGEVQPLVQRPAVSAIAAPTPADAARGDIEARLSSLERDITALAARTETQRAATASATAAGQGQTLESTAGSTAQVEISRSERLASQANDLRDRLDALAGDAARQSASGRDVAPAMQRIGSAIERIEALKAK